LKPACHGACMGSKGCAAPRLFRESSRETEHGSVGSSFVERRVSRQ